MVIVVTSGPVAATVLMVVRAGPVRAEALWASKLATTAAASHGAPLWNTRFGRRVIVQTV